MQVWCYKAMKCGHTNNWLDGPPQRQGSKLEPKQLHVPEHVCCMGWVWGCKRGAPNVMEYNIMDHLIVYKSCARCNDVPCSPVALRHSGKRGAQWT